MLHRVRQTHANRFSKNLSVVQAALMLGSSIFGNSPPDFTSYSPTLISSQILKPLSLRSPATMALEPSCLSKLQIPAYSQIQTFQQLSPSPDSTSADPKPPRRCRALLRACSTPSLRELGSPQLISSKTGLPWVSDKLRWGDGPAGETAQTLRQAPPHTPTDLALPP